MILTFYYFFDIIYTIAQPLSNDRLPRFYRLNKKGRDEMSATTLLVHVPVDDLEIVRGSLGIRQLFFFLGNRKDDSIEMTVHLRTTASSVTFKRKLTITEVTGIINGRRSDDIVYFRGLLAGQQVEGEYFTKTRTGSIWPANLVVTIEH